MAKIEVVIYEFWPDAALAKTSYEAVSRWVVTYFSMLIFNQAHALAETGSVAGGGFPRAKGELRRLTFLVIKKGEVTIWSTDHGKTHKYKYLI